MIYNLKSNMRVECYQERKLDSLGNVASIEPPKWCGGKELQRMTVTIDLVFERGDEHAKRLNDCFAAINGIYEAAGMPKIDIPEAAKERGQ